MTRDPVCERLVDEQKAWELGLTAEHEGQVFYFCGAQCRQEFEHYPHFYGKDPTTEVDLPWWVPGIRGS